MTPQTFQYVNRELNAIRSEMLDLEHRFLAGVDDIPAARLASARNLIHYLALRRHDLRSLQEQLAAWGLSSLGRAEPHVLQNVQAVLDVLEQLGAGTATQPPEQGRAILRSQTDQLLGPAPGGRDVRIMVTMPGDAAHDDALVRDLVASGMDCMRINCAHDDRDTWSRILEHLARANRETGQGCRALIDLAGPKLRTGSIQPGAAVARWRPERDVYGRAVRPARIWVTDVAHPRQAPEPGATTVPVDGGWLNRLAIGDRVKLRDARDARRERGRCTSRYSNSPDESLIHPCG